MSPRLGCSIVCTFLLSILSIENCVFGAKINQKIFVDVESINFADSQKNGFLLILHEHFVKNYLQDILLPTVYVTVQRLSLAKHATDQNNAQRMVKILYPESLQDGKVIKIDGLATKSWYQICVEFENMNRHNETTGASCKMFRTLDKFGKPAETLVTDAAILSIDPERISLSLSATLDFPTKLMTYLRGGSASAEAKIFFLSNTSGTLTTVFDNLQPATDYGSVCVLQEPSPYRASYTAMGRLIQTQLHRCFLEGLKTKSALTSRPLPPQELLQRDHVIHETSDQGAYHSSSRNNGAKICSVSLTSSLFVVFMWILKVSYIFGPSDLL